MLAFFMETLCYLSHTAWWEAPELLTLSAVRRMRGDGQRKFSSILWPGSMDII